MYTILKGNFNIRHSKDFIMRQPSGIDSYILLIVRTPARFFIGNSTYTVKQPSAFIIRPGIPYSYSGLDDEYINDFLRFSCSVPDFDQKYRSLLEKPIPISNTLQYTLYIQHILWEYHYADTTYKAANISMLFCILLNKLSQEAESTEHLKHSHAYISRLRDLRLAMHSDPAHQYTAKELAESMHISPSYFQHLYKELFHTSFKADLINIRIDYAQTLITHSTLTLTQIAATCGYTNEVHFYRQFKSKTGMTPREYANTLQRLHVSS